MPRTLCQLALAGVMVAVLAGPARSQYRYPPGYGGWGGWGGASTAAGSHAMGMGVYAAGAGSYNEQTSEARAQNANTAMQMNEYMYQVNQRNAQTYYSRMAAQQKQTEQDGEQIFQRIHDDPTPRDVHQGDALNAILDDLINPKVYGAALQAGTQPIDSSVVKAISFEYASQAITTTLSDLVEGGAPDVLLTEPAFENNRRYLKSLVAEARKEHEAQGKVSPETYAKFRQGIKSAVTKVEEVYPVGSRERTEAENYLKALYGLSKMLQTPKIGDFLRGLDKTPTTTIGQLVAFMHSFNLRFGVAKGPEGEAAYDQLYAALAQLRDKVQAPASNPFGLPPEARPDTGKVTGFFSGMDYSHFQPQPDPHTGAVPTPPAPGR